MTIKVIQIESEYPLGTEDGQQYTIYPSPPDNDEDGLHGANK